jgi:hypothetical protein
LQGSLRPSPTRSPSGSPHGSATSLPAESPLGAMELFDRSNTPVKWTHSRSTGRQFTGVSSRSRSRTSSPFRRHPSRPNTPTRHDIHTSTRPLVIRHAHVFPEGSTSEVSVQIEQPSRPASPDSEDTHSMGSSSHFRLSPLQGRTQSHGSPTRHRLQSTESVNPSVASSHSGEHSPSMYVLDEGAHQSRGSIQDPMTSQSIQAPPGPPPTFPEPFFPHLSTQTSATNTPNYPFPPALGTRVRPMNSDQVSRYVKKGDV